MLTSFMEGNLGTEKKERHPLLQTTAVLRDPRLAVFPDHRLAVLPDHRPALHLFLGREASENPRWSKLINMSPVIE